jgi:hypothetical protein
MSTLYVNTINPATGSITSFGTNMVEASMVGNPASMAADTTIAENYNYTMVGPITVNSDIALIVSGNLKIS